MKRRTFLGLAAIAAVPIAYGAYRTGSEEDYNPRRPAPLDKAATAVSLAGVKGGADAGQIKSAVREAVQQATDFSWLSRGDTVFIKPALNSGLHYPSTTHPAAVAAVIELLKQKGAGRVVVGDMSGIEHVKLTPEGVTGSTRKLMIATGMAQAVEAAGGKLHFFEESGWGSFFEDMPKGDSNWNSGLMMPNILKEVDHIVLMPRCARHVLAGATLGLKAAVGYWRTDTRLEYHRDASTFHEKTAEGNTVPVLREKQRLVVSAADKILTSFGPDKGWVHTPENGLIMASESVVAHDMASLAWLLINREAAPESSKGITDDPYQMQFIVNAANHWVTAKLGGFGPMIAAEKLKRHDIASIWDDRVLLRAFEVFGGTPRLELTVANGAVPDDVLKRLTDMTAYPAGA